MTTDLRTQALAAVLAVDPAHAGSVATLRVHAGAAMYKATTGLGLRELMPHVNWAIEQVRNTRLDGFKVPADFGWAYRFPNGHEASVINDPHRPFRFELLSKALNVGGDTVAGLTSEQVEAKLHEIAALPAR